MTLQIVADVQAPKIADHSVVGWGYTYFVRRGTTIKIGHSAVPKDRITALQTGFPEPLDVLAVVQNTIIDEPTAHRKFAHLRVSGEWFRAAPDLLEFIEHVKTEAAKISRRPYPALKATELSEAIDRCCRHLVRLRQKQSPEMRRLISVLIEQLKSLPGKPYEMRPLIRRTIELIETPTPAP